MLFLNSAYTLIYIHTSSVNYPGGVSLVRFNEYYKNVDKGTPSCHSTESLAEFSPSACSYIQFGGTDRRQLIPPNALCPVPPFPSQPHAGNELEVQ